MTNILTYEDWKAFVQKHGVSATVMELDWLKKGCPICGCKEWDVSGDGWCYCRGCYKGFNTNGIWTRRSLSYFDETGFHCFMCKGIGRLYGKKCPECFGWRTQPEEKEE